MSSGDIVKSPKTEQTPNKLSQKKSQIRACANLNSILVVFMEQLFPNPMLNAIK
mgnify:CR=1 FL=1